MIYLASPYSMQGEPWAETARLKAVCRATTRLMLQGHAIFSPVAYGASLMAHGGAQGEWDYWREFDLEMLRLCDELWVLMLAGWRDSVGVAAEIEEARRLGLTVRFIDPGTLKEAP